MFYVWCALFTVVGFVLGAVFAAAALVFLPADFFLPSRKRKSLALPLHIGKNIVGVALVLLGVVMLITPGQGLLTIVIGLMLVDFPGKHALVQKLLAQPRLLQGANRWRAKFGKPPLQTAG